MNTANQRVSSSSFSVVASGVKYIDSARDISPSGALRSVVSSEVSVET
jgi:hypothetical protein